MNSIRWSETVTNYSIHRSPGENHTATRNRNAQKSQRPLFLRRNALLLSCMGDVEHCNDQVAALISRSGELSLSNGKLLAMEATRQRWLEEVVGLGSSHSDLLLGHGVFIEQPNKYQKLRMSITPIKKAGFTSSHSEAAWLFEVCIASKAPSGADQFVLRKLFDFTQAEAAVATELTNGRNLNEIAELRRVSVQTLRQQLKTVFSKTNCQSQHQLVAKILNEPSVRYPEWT